MQVNWNLVSDKKKLKNNTPHSQTKFAESRLKHSFWAMISKLLHVGHKHINSNFLPSVSFRFLTIEAFLALFFLST